MVVVSSAKGERWVSWTARNGMTEDEDGKNLPNGLNHWGMEKVGRFFLVVVVLAKKEGLVLREDDEEKGRTARGRERVK